MKFLLTALNAKYIHSNPALYSLKRYAGEYSAHVEIAEYTINNRREEILEDIFKRKPDVIGFSCYIWNIDMIGDILADLHKLMPDLPIWLGGPEVSYDPVQVLERFPMVSGVMVGEGEQTFAELLNYYVEEEERHATEEHVAMEFGTKDDAAEGHTTICAQNAGECGKGQDALAKIPGLYIKSGSTGAREPLNMDELPFLYEEMEPFANRIIYYESQRGCPYRCSYCLSSIDKTVRFRNLDVVKKELQFFLDKKVKQVKFVDRTFNCNHAHAMEIWNYILKNDNGVTNFHFEIAGDIINDEELEILGKMRPGLVQLEIGVQTVNTDTLREIRRNMDLNKLQQVVAHIQEGRNVHIHLDLIAGLPYEDYESFQNSFNVVYGMNPQQLQLGFLKVLKGSYMQEMTQAYGLVYTVKAPYEVLYTNWISYEEIRRLKKVEEMVELYYNSNQFTHVIPYLEHFFATPFALYEALADYYEEKGLFIQTPSRMYRYQVLLDFVRERCVGESVGPQNAHPTTGEAVPDRSVDDLLLRELLLFDLYLRENLKSRPDFAKDITPCRQPSRLLHLEDFSYRVWEKEVTRLSQKQRIQFHYEKRSPLTYEAEISLVDAE